MTTELPHGVYGTPPKELASVPAGALQVSPLIPGSQDLASLADGSLATFTILAPPGTIERRYVLAQALRALTPGANLVALAPKDKGGSRLKKELESLGCAVSEESRAHNKICTASTPLTLTASSREAILEGAPRFLEGIGFTQPGVFSWDRIDPGSLMLAELLPVLGGEGADLGCGIVFLSKELLFSKKVRHLSLFEIDRRAVECARKNLEAHKGRVSIRWADLRSVDPGVSNLDFIVTNPPFHDAGAEDQGLGQGFLQQAGYLLRPGGTLWIVANRHLPYEALLRSLFSEVKETSGFKAYKAVR